MLSDFLDEGPKSALTNDQANTNTTFPTPKATAPAPTTSPTPTAPTTGAMDTFLGQPIGRELTNPLDATTGPGALAPVSTAAIAPGIPEAPFGGAGAGSPDPLAFAPFTPSTPPATPAATASTTGETFTPMELGAPQMTPDTSGFLPGDTSTTAPTAFTGTPAVEQYGQDVAFTPKDVGAPQMTPDTSGFPGGDISTAPIAFTGTPAVERYGQDYGTAPLVDVGPPQQQSDTVPFNPTPTPIGRPTDTGLPVNDATPIAPTYAPVSVNNPVQPVIPAQTTEAPAAVAPVSTASTGILGQLPPDAQAAANAYLANPTEGGLAGIPDWAHNALRQMANQSFSPPALTSTPQGTPTPAATMPASTLPAQTQQQLATMTGGTKGPEQGALPPVSVNGLKAAPLSSMVTESAGNLGGGGTVPTPPVTPQPISTPPVAAPVTPPVMVPPTPTPVAAPTAPIAVSNLGLGGNAVPTFNPATVPTTGSAYAPQTTAVTPETALTNQQISVAPTADRFALAQQKFSDFVNQSNPAYQAALREATQRSAAAGGLGSGMLRTSYGNAELARENALNTARNQFLTEALQGTIGDAYQNAQIAAQQQGFQNAQQQQAFQQAMAQRQLEDQLTNSAFARASQQLASGSTGSPAEMGLTLANLFGNQAGQAGSSAAGIAAAIQAQQNADRQYQLMSQYFNNMGIQVPGMTGRTNTGPIDWSTPSNQATLQALLGGGYDTTDQINMMPPEETYYGTL